MKGPQAIKVQLGDLQRRTENSSTAADHDHGGREDIGDGEFMFFCCFFYRWLLITSNKTSRTIFEN